MYFTEMIRCKIFRKIKIKTTKMQLKQHKMRNR